MNQTTYFSWRILTFVVKLLFKWGNNVNKYYYIYMLCIFFFKYQTKIVKTRFIFFLEINRHLSKTLILNSIWSQSDIWVTLKKKKKDNYFSVDLSIAFGTVDHIKLIRIQLNYDVVNGSFKRFKSYLKNKKQMVYFGTKIELNLAHHKVVFTGPILLILYINNKCNLSVDRLVVTHAGNTWLLFLTPHGKLQKQRW